MPLTTNFIHPKGDKVSVDRESAEVSPEMSL